MLDCKQRDERRSGACRANEPANNSRVLFSSMLPLSDSEGGADWALYSCPCTNRSENFAAAFSVLGGRRVILCSCRVVPAVMLQNPELSPLKGLFPYSLRSSRSFFPCPVFSLKVTRHVVRRHFHVRETSTSTMFSLW